MVGLIAIGFAAGFFTHRQITVKQINKIADMRFATGFKRSLYRVIGAGDQQRDTLAPIVDDYSQRIAAELRESRERHREMLDSMYEAIKPHLSEEQRKELQYFNRRFRERERYLENGRDQRRPKRRRE